MISRNQTRDRINSDVIENLTVFCRLPQGLAASCPRALRPGTPSGSPPHSQTLSYSDGLDGILERNRELTIFLGTIQPGRKHRRRQARLQKAAAVAPRPVDKLRPVVRCPTLKYNRRVRAGRGFTLAELKVIALQRSCIHQLWPLSLRNLAHVGELNETHAIFRICRKPVSPASSPQPSVLLLIPVASTTPRSRSPPTLPVSRNTRLA